MIKPSSKEKFIGFQLKTNICMASVFLIFSSTASQLTFVVLITQINVRSLLILGHLWWRCLIMGLSFCQNKVFHFLSMLRSANLRNNLELWLLWWEESIMSLETTSGCSQRTPGNWAKDQNLKLPLKNLTHLDPKLWLKYKTLIFSKPIRS